MSCCNTSTAALTLLPCYSTTALLPDTVNISADQPDDLGYPLPTGSTFSGLPHDLTTPTYVYGCCCSRLDTVH